MIDCGIGNDDGTNTTRYTEKKNSNGTWKPDSASTNWKTILNVKCTFFNLELDQTISMEKRFFWLFIIFFKYCKKPICQQIVGKYIQNKYDELLNYGRQICRFGLIEMIANHNTWPNDGENR